jgi:hypothetical protein
LLTPDDLLPMPRLIARVRSNGSSTWQGNWSTTIAFAELDDDPWSTETDEVRARVTASPLFPAMTTRDSNLVNLGEIMLRSQGATQGGGGPGGR